MHTIIELAVPVYCIWVFIGLCLFGFGGTVYTMVSTPVEEEKLKDALKWANAGVAGRETQIVDRTEGTRQEEDQTPCQEIVWKVDNGIRSRPRKAPEAGRRSVGESKEPTPEPRN